MAKSYLKERRYSIRYPLMGDLSGSIYANNEMIRCLAVDVSHEGLRILAFQELLPQTEVLLKMLSNEVLLKVIWSQLESDIKQQYAIGLKALDDKHDLVRIFGLAGWLDDVTTTDDWLSGIEMVRIAPRGPAN